MENDLSGEMPSIWHQCKDLKYLLLGDNMFNPGIIPSDIEICDQPPIIYLHNNNLKGEIPLSLFSISTLRNVVLAKNNLNGNLPILAGNETLLEKLQLQYNSFTGGIPSFIWNMSSLRVVNLGMNHLNGNLPEELCQQLPLLEIFDVDSNQLEGSIPKSISNCTSLKKLYLDGNSFTGMGLPNLIELRLTGNELTGQIPNSISNASKLISLDLSLNKFNEAIPNMLGNLSNLIQLSVDGNDLNGLIPHTIGKLHSLQYLSLSSNGLQGSIIDELCQLKSLSELYLANNMFSGVVPRCLGNTSLRKLNLSSNKLISHIPSSLWSLKDILAIDMSSNALSGTISPEVSNLRTIILLNLSRNQISGSIPTTMGGLQTLISLSLAQNKLQRHIPKSLGSMVSLESMDLSHNYLSGVIPKSLELLVHLQHINLSYNLLHGEIPSRGRFQNFTAESFMMNNGLCGKSLLQVHPCREEHKHISNKVKLLIKCSLPIICMVVILVVLGIVFLKCKRDHVNDSTNRDLIDFDIPTRISYYELWQGTNGFDKSNLLGFGSFGLVYKATLPNSKIVAVKVFKVEMEEALRSFDIECVAMCNLRHRNLIKIISCCSNDHFKSLIMEFMENGSLDKWLYSHNYCLNVLQRLNIMIDVAAALEYLHHSSSTLVVHCDVKPSNVLLDEDMVAHLSDFGIARLFSEGQLEIYTKTLATIGYMAPEYGSEGVVSVKGDVYSYGILLMEMFTRKKPTDEMFVEGLSLKHWVSKSTPHSITNILDANLLLKEHQNICNILPYMSLVFELALNCCHDLPEARLSMADVVVSLKKIKVIFMENVRGTSS
ncbi:receptor kinase-like protein Xa21 isoform X2 [Prosopis cineraria]|uniref:receptor kinase-like protein Xa21 isoform X2 n=1 Tax=Prosopis cineraria TaxID=364024 RepID=UPI00240F3D83|nr:receptor kinase-like protein Xa21 isoform X2 [Prosopis cineraria]